MTNNSTTWSTSETIEVGYQMAIFLVGTPLNVYALLKTNRKLRYGGVETRLMKLSRQLLLAHIMVLFVYGAWRSYWFYTFYWVHGDFTCKLFSFLNALPFHLWSNIVASIAIDMLCCIRSPLSSYRNGQFRVKTFIAVSWAMAIICAFPMLIFKGITDVSEEFGENETVYQCGGLYNEYGTTTILIHHIFHVLTTFYVPLVVIITCYTLIFFSLQQQMTARRFLSDGTKVIRTSATKVRFLRATVAIVSTFVLTWLPYQLFALIEPFCERNSTCAVIMSKCTFLQAFIIVSTCINPFLYRFGDNRQRSKRSTVKSSTYDSAPGAPRQKSSLARTADCSAPLIACRTLSLTSFGDRSGTKSNPV